MRYLVLSDRRHSPSDLLTQVFGDNRFKNYYIVGVANDMDLAQNYCTAVRASCADPRELIIRGIGELV